MLISRKQSIPGFSTKDPYVTRSKSLDICWHHVISDQGGEPKHRPLTLGKVGDLMYSSHLLQPSSYLWMCSKLQNNKPYTSSIHILGDSQSKFHCLLLIAKILHMYLGGNITISRPRVLFSYAFQVLGSQTQTSILQGTDDSPLHKSERWVLCSLLSYLCLFLLFPHNMS